MLILVSELLIKELKTENFLSILAAPEETSNMKDFTQLLRSTPIYLRVTFYPSWAALR